MSLDITHLTNYIPALDVQEIQTTPSDDQNGNLTCELPVKTDVLIKLQQEDEFCNNILQQIEKGNVKEGQLYKIDNQQLKGLVTDGNNTYETIVIPSFPCTTSFAYSS